MQTSLADFIKDTPEGEEADAILRSCVHCGFCLAVCPTYQLLGDELDSPRGRIYLMKQVMEGAPVTEKTQCTLTGALHVAPARRFVHRGSATGGWLILVGVLLKRKWGGLLLPVRCGICSAKR